MITLTASLIAVANGIIAQFQSDSLRMAEELHKAKEVAVKVKVSCSMVSMEIEGYLPEYSIECDPYYPGEDSGD